MKARYKCIKEIIRLWFCWLNATVDGHLNLAEGYRYRYESEKLNYKRRFKNDK